MCNEMVVERKEVVLLVTPTGCTRGRRLRKWSNCQQLGEPDCEQLGQGEQTYRAEVRAGERWGLA